MADHDLRTLERQARATGSPSDRAALLRARVRSGDLSQEMLELLSWLREARRCRDPEPVRRLRGARA